MKFYAIIPAAGSGSRFGGSTKKQFLTLGGRSLLDCVLSKFIAANIFQQIVVTLPREEMAHFVAGQTSHITVVEGGESRSESVYKGFCELKAGPQDVVLVHDAARPLVSQNLIERVAEMTGEKGAVVPVIPLRDTVKKVNSGLVEATLDRDTLFRVQTPQGFRYEYLAEAYKKKSVLTEGYTDEAMMIEELGFEVFVTDGEAENIKVTTALDLKIAEAILNKQS